MLKQSYEQIRKELAKENIFEINDVYGFLTITFEVVLYTLCFAILLQTRYFSLAYWLLELFMGFSLFRFYIIIHECSHKNLFRAKYLNNIVGTLASLFCLIPYIPWRNLHIGHHLWAGIVDKDPLYASLLNLKNSKASHTLLRLLWKLWIPLGLVNYMIDMFWKYPLKQLKEGNLKNARLGFISVILILVTQIVLIVYLGLIKYLILFIPMQCIFYWLIENLTIFQHIGLMRFNSKNHPDPIPYYEQDSLARSMNFPNILAITLNYNNLHIEHHLYPNVPWYNLPKVKQYIQRCSDLEYNNVNFWDFITNLHQQDGVDIHIKDL